MMDRLAHTLAWLRRNDSGVAAVEFALVLPIMLLIYIGTVEASALVSMDRRVQSVTGALGDLVARSSTTITDEMLTDYFQAASGIMTPFSAAGLAQVVTQVEVMEDRTVEVAWCRQYIGGDYSECTTPVAGDAFPLPDAMIDISLEGFVIVAETTYSYKPLYGIVFDQPVNLYRENFYLPRFGGSISVDD